MAEQPHVVVLGAGFAGVGALQRLQKAPVRVTLVDRNDHHAFQPLLYQVATSQITADAVSFPAQSLADREGTAFVQAQVSSVDLAARRVVLEGRAPLPYDYLLVALGAVVNFFGTKGAGEHALPLYTLEDSLRLRSRISECLRLARQDPGQVEDGVLNFCVVGGGATGVEVAGALAELLEDRRRRPDATPAEAAAEVHLFELQPELLTSFKPPLRQYAREALEQRGVQVEVGEAVVEVTPNRLHLRSGRVIKTHTVVWAAGLQGNDVAGSLGEARRPEALPDLSLPGYPEVFLAGDMATIVDAKSGERLPQLGSVAQQSGHRAGDNIVRAAAGKPTRPFEYNDKGTMAIVGRGDAVVQLRSGRALTGKPAWLAWKAVHLMLLKGGEQKARALLEWSSPWPVAPGSRAARD